MTDFRHIPLSHFYAFAHVMREPALCRRFLETVLGVKILKLVFVEKEVDLSDSAGSHGIRLDVYVEDDANSVYDVEMQNRLETMKRVRYYQSGIDRRLLEKGAHYSELKTSFVIMVCNYDPTRVLRDPKDPGSREIPGLAYPLYRRVSTLDSPVGLFAYEDGSHAIFLNAKYDPKYREDMPEICEFLDLLNATEDLPPEDMHYPLGRMAAAGITRFRQDEEKGGAFMTFQDKLRDEAFMARKEGEAIGRAEGEAIGRAEGEAIGRAEGEAIGRAEGEAAGLKKAVHKLMAAQNLSREEAERILL